MTNLLLIGAGFSRNWGGWLAGEVFEYLLGRPEIENRPDLRKLLFRHQEHGGFEAALAELQIERLRNQDVNHDSLISLQAAIRQMFNEMNTALMDTLDWQLGQQYRERQIDTFLIRFDAIFTLNQDVLLEQHYTSDGVMLCIGPNRWNGLDLPGMVRHPPQSAIHHSSWARSTWMPRTDGNIQPARGTQPIYKLHGSSNWVRADGLPLLILGGGKEREIQLNPILDSYAKEFEKRLSIDNSRLMTIGYGFRDEHINSAIFRAVEKGLKFFVIDPRGANLAREENKTRQPNKILVGTELEAIFEKALVGTSSRNLREIFGGDGPEFAKVMSFFER
ncbi:MAG: hypothetical protein EBR89_07035 [Betaproteobacteria bacterium]|nr:hypothetical protein [Betaproteobacteria bacterium]